MGFDDALDAILALESRWNDGGGRVRLRDLGIGPHLHVRTHGRAERVPEHWRRYPGTRPVHTERVED